LNIYISFLNSDWYLPTIYQQGSGEEFGSVLYREVFRSLQHLTRQNPDYAAFAELMTEFKETARWDEGSRGIEDLPYFKVS